MWLFPFYTKLSFGRQKNFCSSETGSVVLKLDQNRSSLNSLWVLHRHSVLVLVQVWFCSPAAGGLDLNSESQSGGSDPDPEALDLGMDGKKDCIFSRNSDKLWTSISFHTVAPMSPTPHQAHRDPQPRALRARDAPDSGTAAVAATPCNDSQSHHQIRTEQEVKETPAWNWINEAKFTEKLKQSQK